MKKKTNVPEPEYSVLAMAMELRDLCDDWDRQDEELREALAMLSPSADHENQWRAINVVRSRKVDELISKAGLCPGRMMLEAVADIAFIAGARRYHTGDSREDVQSFIKWAEEFEKQRMDDNEKDYMTAIEELAESKLEEQYCKEQDVRQIEALKTLYYSITKVEGTESKFQCNASPAQLAGIYNLIERVSAK